MEAPPLTYRFHMPATLHSLPSSPPSPRAAAESFCFTPRQLSFNNIPACRPPPNSLAFATTTTTTVSRKAQTDLCIPVDSEIEFLGYDSESNTTRLVSRSSAHAASETKIPENGDSSNTTYTLPPSPVDHYDSSVSGSSGPASPRRWPDRPNQKPDQYRPLSPARSPGRRDRSDSFSHQPVCVSRHCSPPRAHSHSPVRRSSSRPSSGGSSPDLCRASSRSPDSRPGSPEPAPQRHVLPPTPPEHQFLRPEPPRRPREPMRPRPPAEFAHNVHAKPFDLSIKFKHKLYHRRSFADRMGVNSSSLDNIDSDTLRASDLFNSTAFDEALNNETRNSTPNGSVHSGASSGKKTPSPSTSTPKELTDKPSYSDTDPGRSGKSMANMGSEAQMNNFPSPDTPGQLDMYKDPQMSLPGMFLPNFPGPIPRYSPHMLTVLNSREGLSMLPGMDGRLDQSKALDELAMNQMKLLAAANMQVLPTSRPDDLASMKYAQSPADAMYFSQPSPSSRSERSQSRYSDISDCPPPKLNNRDYNVNIIDANHSSPLSPDGREFAPHSPQIERAGFSRRDGLDEAKYLPAGYSPQPMSQTIADSLRLADSLRHCTGNGNGKTERMENSPCAYGGMDQRHHRPHQQQQQQQQQQYHPSGDGLLHCSEIKKEYDVVSECSYADKSHNMDMFAMMQMPGRIGPQDYNRKRPSQSSSFGSDSDSSGVRSPKPTKYRKAIENMLCSVCGDCASGFHCGAYVCEACKKFFIRSSKNDSVKFVCSKQKQCDVTKESRTQCQFCRYKKCLDIGMFKPGSNPLANMNANMANYPCKVCGAPSSGYHFGAITCEGCKGFFRRTIKERDSHRYVCPKRGQCSVTMVTRNFCKFCRYQKCLNVGMTPEGSRIGRQPNSVKHQTLMELQQITTHSPQSSITSPSSSEPTTPRPKDVASPYLLRRQQTGFTRGDMDTVIGSLMSSFNHLKLLQKKPDDMGDIPSNDLMTVWDCMMKQFNFDAHNVLKFAKKIPGFKTLPVDDQVILLQNSMYQTCMFMHVDQYQLYSDKINYFNFSEEDRHTIMSLFPSFKVFESHYHYFGETFNPLKLDDKETACMVALQIVSPLDSGMATWKEIAQLQETIMISLQMYIEEKEGPDSERFGVLLLQLPALNSAGIKHQQIITQLRNDRPELPFPQLFKELFLSYEDTEAKFSNEEKDLIEKGIALCEKMTNERNAFNTYNM